MADEPPYRLTKPVDPSAIAVALRQAANDLDALAVVLPPIPDLESGASPRAFVLAKNLLALRRKRDRLFPAGLFAEPAWDLLLDLFVAGAERRRISVSSACIAAAVPPTTGLRWLTQLERDGLVCRVSDPSDGRRVYVALSEHAEALLSQLLG